MTALAQGFMAVALAASSGLRASAPLLLVGILARGGYLQLNPAFAFVARTDFLIVLGIGAILEFLGDKVAVIDHALDAIGHVIRPAAGTLLASSMFVEMDPLAATALGIVAGGVPSLSVQAAKTKVRLAVTKTMPVKGNLAASVAEDVISGFTYWLAIHAPAIAFVLSVLAVIGAAVLVVFVWKAVLAFFERARGKPGRTPDSIASRSSAA